MRRADDLEIGADHDHPSSRRFPARSLDRFCRAGGRASLPPRDVSVSPGRSRRRRLLPRRRPRRDGLETANGNRVLHATSTHPDSSASCRRSGRCRGRRASSPWMIRTSGPSGRSRSSSSSPRSRRPPAGSSRRSPARSASTSRSPTTCCISTSRDASPNGSSSLVTPTLDDLPTDGVVVPAVTHADLASLCGGSRARTSPASHGVAATGLIERDGHRYVLKKVAGLAKIADL